MAAYCLLPIFMLPFLLVAYLLHLGVTRHAVYVWKEGNLVTRFIEGVQERRDMWCKYFGIGFLMAMNESYTEAKENGEWRVRHVNVCMQHVHVQKN